jgi:hypothetical protein
MIPELPSLPPEKPFRLEMSHGSVIAFVSLAWASLIIGALVLGFAISQIRPTCDVPAPAPEVST